MPDVKKKYKSLLASLARLSKAAVAFSGGVDSTLLLVAAKEALGVDSILAYSVKTPYMLAGQLDGARDFCSQTGIKHHIVYLDFINEIQHNPKNRCYICKNSMLGIIKAEAAREGIQHLLDGTNVDDTAEHRPGMLALKEHNVFSPFLDCMMTKQDIRDLSRMLDLATAEKPADTCLLTRFPYNYNVSQDALQRVEKAESYLESLGYTGLRVRSYNTTARIELERKNIKSFIDKGMAEKTVHYFKSLGYVYITLDLEGYRSGSFDKTG